jgi:phenylalanyl-tRNA synthetase alpha subunit
MGCGMIHPEVFKAVNIDTEDFTGFAFGTNTTAFTITHHTFDIHFC